MLQLNERGNSLVIARITREAVTSPVSCVATNKVGSTRSSPITVPMTCELEMEVFFDVHRHLLAFLCLINQLCNTKKILFQNEKILFFRTNVHIRPLFLLLKG